MKHVIVFVTIATASVAAVLYALVSPDKAAAAATVDATVASTTHGAQLAAAGLPVAASQSGNSLVGIEAQANQPPSGHLPEIAPGVKYQPLDEQPWSPEWKERLRKQLQNLREVGSLSGGKVTHEFARLAYMSENLQKKGLKNLLAQLAIEPTDLSGILGPSFVLVGADSQGKWMEKKGAAAYFQIVRNVSGDQLAELSERQLDILGGDGTLIAPEFENAKIAGFPATLEQLVDPDGAVLRNAQWATEDRTFHLTTKNMDADQVQQLATAITQRFEAMKFDGWRERYEFDYENPAHRIARAESKDKGRW